MTLEDLREFLQEKIAASLQYEDDAVIEQLQVSMSELRKMKFDLPPPGRQSPQPPDPCCHLPTASRGCDPPGEGWSAARPSHCLLPSPGPPPCAPPGAAVSERDTAEGLSVYLMLFFFIFTVLFFTFYCFSIFVYRFIFNISHLMLRYIFDSNFYFILIPLLHHLFFPLSPLPPTQRSPRSSHANPWAWSSPSTRWL